MVISCKNCFKEFTTWLSRIKSGKGKYCSHSCYSVSLIGKTNSSTSKFVKGQKAWNKGIPFSEETREKMSIADKGKHRSPATEFKKGQNIEQNHFNWKDDKVGYSGIHMWIKSRLGLAKFCSHCRSINDNSTKYGWANISRLYKRDLSDWISLCAKCHSAYDKNNKQTAFDSQRRRLSI